MVGRGDLFGVAAATVSSLLGGTAVAATRLAVAGIDPVALALLRFGIGVSVLLPIVALGRRGWPRGRDLVSAGVLGLLFFAAFPCLFNAALVHTTASRGALALSTLPLLTMMVAAVLGAERPTPRKLAGVLAAIGGVGAVLFAGLDDAPAGAWAGDMLMVGAAGCGAVYNVLSRPIIARSDPLTYTAAAMAAGTAALLAAFLATGAGLPAFTGAGLWSIAYLGTFGSALTFFLWAVALRHTTPTRVAVTVTANPVAASLAAVLLLAEPVTPGLLAGLLAVAAGILLAASGRQPGISRPARHPGSP